MVELDIALFIIRLFAGLILAAHGSQKLFGWFDGQGIEGTTGMTENLNLNPPRLWAWVNGLTEFLGGLGLALGLLTPLAAVAVLGAMLVAIFKVHWPKFWNTDQGLEYPLVLAVIAFSIGLVGPGIYSLDNAVGLPLETPMIYTVLLVITVLAVSFVLLQSRESESMTQQEAT
jgi:putative oxidoreductase